MTAEIKSSHKSYEMRYHMNDIGIANLPVGAEEAESHLKHIKDLLLMFFFEEFPFLLR